jgi:hypothetical protein
MRVERYKEKALNDLSDNMKIRFSVTKRNHIITLICSRSVLISFIAAVMLTGAISVSEAEEQFPDRFMIRLGGYTVRNADTIMRLDANNLPIGTYVDFQKTLGGETTSTVLWLDGMYRFNEKHALTFSWYDLRFRGSRVLGQDIEWGGVTYPLSTPVNSEIKFNVYKLSYQYSLYHNDKVELGASFGFHIMSAFASIAATNINQSDSEQITAPLPVWGLSAAYHFSPRFSAFYGYEFFYINYQDTVRGGLSDFLVGLEYRLFRNFALGAAYSRFGLNVKIVGDNKTLYLDTNWNGGMLYGALYF